jgi:hypothetical protein
MAQILVKTFWNPLFDIFFRIGENFGLKKKFLKNRQKFVQVPVGRR